MSWIRCTDCVYLGDRDAPQVDVLPATYANALVFLSDFESTLENVLPSSFEPNDFFIDLLPEDPDGKEERLLDLGDVADGVLPDATKRAFLSRFTLSSWLKRRFCACVARQPQLPPPPMRSFTPEPMRLE